MTSVKEVILLRRNMWSAFIKAKLAICTILNRLIGEEECIVIVGVPVLAYLVNKELCEVQ